jgi:hypothetical protein
VIETTDRKASATTQKANKNKLKKFLTKRAANDNLSELRLTSQDKAL